VLTFSHRLRPLLVVTLGVCTALGIAAWPGSIPSASAHVATVFNGHTSPIAVASVPPDVLGDGPGADSAKKDDAKAAEIPTESDAKGKEEASPTPADSAAEAGEEEEKPPVPQVEIFVPSVTGLCEAASKSKTAELFAALSPMIPKPSDDDDEGMDLAALVKLIDKARAWPDTSLGFTTYTQDREGRPRWALRVDWPPAELEERLAELLENESAAKVFEGVKLTRTDDGVVRLELPDLVLAVLKETDGGALVASADDVVPPDTLYGQEVKKGGKPALAYCRLNLDAGDEDESGDSIFSSMSGIRSVLYSVRLRKDGAWREQFGVSWNPLLGLALKAVFQKTKKPFDCPRDAYAAGVVKIGLGESMVDGIAGLPPGTIGAKAGADLAAAVVPGTGFLPFPDIYFQFRTRRQAAIIRDMRAFIEKDTKKRSEDDRPAAWLEEAVGDRVMFWKNPAADGAYGLMPVTYRTVVFFVRDGDEGSKKALLVVAQTSTSADEAVHHWDRLRSRATKMPSSKKVHWQARIGWKAIYDLAQPYLALLAGFAADTAIPPEADELADALIDSKIDVKIGFGGLRVRHTGPIPFGAVYVPAVAAVSLGATADASSEAARERTACRHLRVLHHHAKLFKKDYGRWPATVAELDGYVDFASHSHLLRLREKDGSFVEGLLSVFSEARPEEPDEEEDDDAIDDSLYVIDWAANETAGWKLKIRDGEFVRHETIYIDGEGMIHRVEKKEETQTDNPEGA